MSLTLTITGKYNELNKDYFPPIELHGGNYAVGLINFNTYNSIPNVTEKNNKFHYNGGEVLTIPVGAYEIVDINKFIRKSIESSNDIENDANLRKILSGVRTTDKLFVLNPNNNTLKCEIASTFEIDFTKNESIGSMLGFTKKKLPPYVLHTSDFTVNIIKVNSILIECNITTGSYRNERLAHIIHEFYPSVPPGYKIIEIPRNVIYLPVNVRTINNISLKLVDQDGDIVNFLDEIITVRLHLKRI